MARQTYGTEISSEFIGKREEDGWPHFEWRVTLTRGDQKRVLPYRMGLAHVQTLCGKPLRMFGKFVDRPCSHVRCQGEPKPTPPDLYSVLCSLKADATMGEGFDEWCGNYGLDTDSRKAMDTYLACQASEAESRRLFGSDWYLILEDEDYV